MGLLLEDEDLKTPHRGRGPAVRLSVTQTVTLSSLSVILRESTEEMRRDEGQGNTGDGNWRVRKKSVLDGFSCVFKGGGMQEPHRCAVALCRQFFQSSSNQERREGGAT